VVAVIGEKAILLTDLRQRARPYLIKLYAQVPAGPQRSAAESKIFSQLIERMVDEELESLAANRNSTTVTADEVDKALRRIARASGAPLSKLFADVEANTGMTEVEYRQEIRRQVLEGKLLNRFVMNQRITEQELGNMFERVQKQERTILLYNPAWIVLRLDKDATAAQVAERMTEARAMVERVRGGEAFPAVAAQFSEDPDSKDKGGDLGIRVPSTSPRALSGKYPMLNRALEQRAFALEPGELTDPFRFKDAIVVMTIVSRQPSRYTSLAASRAEMAERVRAEKLQNIKDKWLQDLRRRTHVDVRL
jgi:peptidyl-prolyl cis-trans isomerase SurA